MESDYQKKVRHTCARIAFLMEHQTIVPDLKEMVSEINPEGNSFADSGEYLKGAQDALNYLIGFLEQKGS
jgi:hypothetical protein